MVRLANNEPGLPIGLEQISRYCGVSRWTLRRWPVTAGFPMARLPNGKIATSRRLIDQWLSVFIRGQQVEAAAAAAPVATRMHPVPMA